MEKGRGKGTDTLQTDKVFTRKEYIEREEFIADQRHLYCENCGRRKGMKNGKMKFVYGIGDVPCRACDIGDMLDSVEDYPAADVVPVRHGRWVFNDELDDMFHCAVCDNVAVRNTFNYCPNCGANMQDNTQKNEY